MLAQWCEHVKHDGPHINNLSLIVSRVFSQLQNQGAKWISSRWVTKYIINDENMTYITAIEVEMIRVSPWRVSISSPQEWDAFKNSGLNDLMILICRHADRTDQKLMLITLTKSTLSNLISPLNCNKNNINNIKSAPYFPMGFNEAGFSSGRSPMSHLSGATRLQRSKRKSMLKSWEQYRKKSCFKSQLLVAEEIHSLRLWSHCQIVVPHKFGFVEAQVYWTHSQQCSFTKSALAWRSIYSRLALHFKSGTQERKGER